MSNTPGEGIVRWDMAARMDESGMPPEVFQVMHPIGHWVRYEDHARVVEGLEGRLAHAQGAKEAMRLDAVRACREESAMRVKLAEVIAERDLLRGRGGECERT